MKKFIPVIIILFIVVIGSKIFLNYKNNQHDTLKVVDSVPKQELSTIVSETNTSSSINENVRGASTTPDYCDCEKTFAKPITTVLNGEVIASFVSGEAIGIKVRNKDGKYDQYYVEMPTGTNYHDIEYDNVKVEGKMVGITCAYYNTIFGECAGDVIADSIKQSTAK